MLDFRLSRSLGRFITDSEEEPDRVLITDSNGQRMITSGQFIRIVDSFTYLLESKGVRKGDVVTIRLDRNAELIASFFSCMSLGCPFVVINPDYSDEQASRILELCDASFVIETSFVSEASELEDVPSHRPIDIKDTDPCVYFFTIGSTGEPKGVLHNRCLIIRGARFMERMKGVEGPSTFASVSDFMSISSINDWSHLMSDGSALHILDNSIHEAVDPLISYIEDHDITHILSGPELLHHLDPEVDLECAIIANGRLDVLKGPPGFRIIDLYGSDELYPILYTEIDNGERVLTHPTIEEEIPFVSKTDDGSNVGEIRIRTSDRSLIAYVNSEGEEDGFVPDGDGWIYHSGDLGRMTEKGIEIVGRWDPDVTIENHTVGKGEMLGLSDENEGNVDSEDDLRTLDDVPEEPTTPLDTYCGEVTLTPYQRSLFASTDPVPLSAVFRIADDVDTDTVRKAIGLLRDRHPMLRATYDGTLKIGPLEKKMYEPTVVTVDSINEAYAKAATFQREGDVFSYALFNIADSDERYLSISLHPGIADPASIRIVTRTIVEACKPSLRGSVVPLPHTMSFVEWTRARESHAVSENAAVFWEGMEEMTEKSFGSIPSQRFWTEFNIRNPISMTELSDNKYGFGLDVILLTATIESARFATGRNEFVLRMVGDGRAMADLEGTVGQFRNEYPLRLRTTRRLLRTLYDVRKAIDGIPRNGIGYTLTDDRILPVDSFVMTDEKMNASGPMTYIRPPGGRVISRILISDTVDMEIVDMGFVFRMVGRGSDKYGNSFKTAFISNIKSIYSIIRNSEVYEYPFFGHMEPLLREWKRFRPYESEWKTSPRLMELEVQLPYVMSKKDIVYIIGDLIKAHPVLRTRTVSKDGKLWGITDNNVLDLVRPPGSATELLDIGRRFVEFFVHHNGSSTIRCRIHRIVCDAVTQDVLQRDLNTLVEGGRLEEDLSMLERSRAETANGSFDVTEDMFAYFDRLPSHTVMSEHSDTNGKGHVDRCSLDIDMERFRSFIETNSMTSRMFFIAAVALTTSKMTRSDIASIVTIDEGRENVQENATGSFSRDVFLAIECRDRTVPEYLSQVTASLSRSLEFIGAINVEQFLKRYPGTLHVGLNYMRSDMKSKGSNVSMGRAGGGLPNPFKVSLDVHEYDDYITSELSALGVDGDFASRFLKVLESCATGLLSAERLSDIVIPDE